MIFDITKWCGRIITIEMSSAEKVIQFAKNTRALKVQNRITGETVYEKKEE